MQNLFVDRHGVKALSLAWRRQKPFPAMALGFIGTEALVSVNAVKQKAPKKQSVIYRMWVDLMLVPYRCRASDVPVMYQ